MNSFDYDTARPLIRRVSLRTFDKYIGTLIQSTVKFHLSELVVGQIVYFFERPYDIQWTL